MLRYILVLTMSAHRNFQSTPLYFCNYSQHPSKLFDSFHLRNMYTEPSMYNRNIYNTRYHCYWTYMHSDCTNSMYNR